MIGMKLLQDFRELFSAPNFSLSRPIYLYEVPNAQPSPRLLRTNRIVEDVEYVHSDTYGVNVRRVREMII